LSEEKDAMLYERSQTIERRLDELLGLIRTGCLSTPALAEKLGVSVPTVSRGIMALRQRGYSIRAVKVSKSWVYELVTEPASISQR
jgi:biotin operon repressor